MSEFACSWSIDDFQAFGVYTGESFHIRVEGSGECPTTGYTVTLDYGNPGINPVPDRLALRIIERKPDEVAHETLTSVTIDELFHAPESTKEVGIAWLGVLQVQRPA